MTSVLVKKRHTWSVQAWLGRRWRDLEAGLRTKKLAKRARARFAIHMSPAFAWKNTRVKKVAR